MYTCIHTVCTRVCVCVYKLVCNTILMFLFLAEIGEGVGPSKHLT